MFSVRRAALRFASTPAISFAARSRTISSFTSSPLRTQKQTCSLVLQKRWASDEVKKEEVPISHLQPTPQEEVENAIVEDNSAQTVDSSTEAPSEAIGSPAVTEGAQASESVSAPAADSQSATQGRDVPKKTIYVGNLFFDVTEDDLRKEMSRFGDIEKIRLIRDARGLSKGFGYVAFSNIDEAKTAIQGLNQQLFEGRRLVVSFAVTDDAPAVTRPRASDARRSANPPSKTLFIGNMSWDMTDRDLNNLFKGIKNIVDVRVAIDRRTGQPRGFAHADFTDTKSAMEGHKALNGKETYGRRLRVDYSYGDNQAPRNQFRDQGDL